MRLKAALIFGFTTLVMAACAHRPRLIEISRSEPAGFRTPASTEDEVQPNFHSHQFYHIRPNAEY